MRDWMLSVLVITGGVTVWLPPANASDWQTQVTDVARWLTGRMEAIVRSPGSSTPVTVRMITCHVQVPDNQISDLNPTVFLYQEQALTDNLAEPYRQRFLQISPSALSQTVRSLAFRPADLKPWRNFCQKSVSERVVQLKDMGQPICSVFLKRSGASYVGSTPLDGCPAKSRGAVRITNHIVLRSDGMTTWDRGFDAHGKQVWGAKTESYQFHKVGIHNVGTDNP